MIKSTFNLEKELADSGYELIVGIDEAGRGPLAGPVVAAAAVLRCHPREGGDPGSELKVFALDSRFPASTVGGRGNDKKENKMWDLIRDSKTLSEKQREKAFDFVTENFFVGVGICDHATIDRINILEASFLAMKKATSSLERAISNFQFPISNEFPMTNYKNAKKIILLDGNKQIPNFSGEQKAIIGGDKLVKSISAASIIAKVTRDRMMREFHGKYPDYGFNKHKGYGTKFHMDALEKHGPCAIHRQTFAPVTKLLK